ncbi:MAG: bacillithiol system redox-active protein YtxJ [Cytophagales bacterium]
MNWNQLTSTDQLAQIQESSVEKPVLIFKHSTRCSISSSALNRVERNWDDKFLNQITPYYLDLISYREVSNAIADIFGVQHQSPQVLLIYKGKSIYDTSHMDINLPEIMSQAKFVM